MIAYLRLEVMRALRAPAFLGYTIVFPAVFYVLFTTVMNHGKQDAAAYLMTSMALYGAVLAALPGAGARIAVERTRGWTRQLAVSPLRPGAYLLMKVLATSMLTIPVVGSILLLGRLVNHVDLPLTTWLTLLGTLWAVSAVFIPLAVLIGYSFRDEVAQGVSMVAVFLLAIVGGLWMPVSMFPHWLARIAELTPTYRAAELGWSVLGATHVTGTGLAVLAAWAALFAGLAAWRFRRAS
jgi:ABC-2 type transport system permease protein